ncbi:MAG: hypothetical protein NW226_19335 [Microscillaceae bacterium]|nr:hypothetical protein [Microscillaceae bacterium]
MSFDENLFEKELRKSIQNLENKDLPQLKSWCDAKFGDLYPHLIDKTFEEILTEKSKIF